MVTPLPAYGSTRALERALGDPSDARSPVSHRRMTECDEHEKPPDDAFGTLTALGLPSRLIPVRDGGRLETFDELLSLLRALSRRDPALAVGYGSTLLAAIPVWRWGDPAQRAQVAAHLRAGRFGACAVSEERTGSDLRRTATTTTRTDGGLRIDGEKWLIGNATRSRFVTLLTRLDDDLSFLLLDKDELPPTGYRHLPKIATLGLRCHDLSGLAFTACQVPSATLLGPAGRGLEMLLSTLRFTRTMVAGIALGTADTALRLALARALERRLYGSEILRLPAVRGLVVEAFLDVLIGECVALSTARALSTDPVRAGLASQIAKYLLPVVCDRVLGAATQVLSARSYVRTGQPEGILQKLVRDAAVFGVFEGTTQIQLAQVAHRLRGTDGECARDTPRPDALYALKRPAAIWQPGATDYDTGRAGPLDALKTWDAADTVPVPAAWQHVRLFRSEQQALRSELAALRRSRHATRDAPALAQRYCVLHAAAACYHAWRLNQAVLSREFTEGRWLVMCWERLLKWTGLARPGPPGDPDAEEAVLAWMLRLYRSGRLMSAVELELPHG